LVIGAKISHGHLAAFVAVAGEIIASSRGRFVLQLSTAALLSSYRRSWSR
jgi:hypothetical protein